MRGPAPRNPPSPHFSWAEVMAHSGYAYLPFGPTAIGNGRLVLTPRINARKHAANLERLRAAVNEARRLKGFGPTRNRVLSWARSFAHQWRVRVQLPSVSARMTPGWGRRRTGARAGLKPTFDDLLERVFANGGVGQYPAGNRHCDSRGRRARWTSS